MAAETPPTNPNGLYDRLTWRNALAKLGLFLTFRSTGNNVATWYMFGVVIFFSLIPVVVSLGDGSRSPFLFNAAWRLGLIAGFTSLCGIYLLVFHRPLINFYWNLLCKEEDFRSLLVSRFKSILLLVAVINGFDYALLAWSIQMIDVSVAAVLFETWPIVFVVLRAKLENISMPRSMFFLFIPALFGLAFVIFSQSESDIYPFEGISSEVYLGGALALLGGMASACTAFSFKWASDLQKDLPLPPFSDNDLSGEQIALSLLPVLFAFVITNLIALPITIGIGLGTGERISIFESSGIVLLAIGFLGGAFVQAVGSKLYRVSNVVTTNLGVNAIYYFTPCFTLVWLVGLGLIMSWVGWTHSTLTGIGVKYVDYLILGTVAIVTSNLLLNLNAEIRVGFKTLILSLMSFGVIVYIREDLFAVLNVSQWHWTGDGYFSAIALSATVFTLLLAFRVARLVTRAGSEESQTYKVFRKFELLAKRNVLSIEAVRLILYIDGPKSNAELKTIYSEIRDRITGICPLNDADAQMLSDAEAELDALVRSRQMGLVLGELFALIIFGCITVGLALLSRPPDVAGLTRLLVDIFAMLLSSVIVFLLFNVWDLHRDRTSVKLERRTQEWDYAVVFLDTERRQIDLWISGFVGGAIVITYVVLLWYRWLD